MCGRKIASSPRHHSRQLSLTYLICGFSLCARKWSIYLSIVAIAVIAVWSRTVAAQRSWVPGYLVHNFSWWWPLPGAVKPWRHVGNRSYDYSVLMFFGGLVQLTPTASNPITMANVFLRKRFGHAWSTTRQISHALQGSAGWSLNFNKSLIWAPWVLEGTEVSILITGIDGRSFSSAVHRNVVMTK